MSSQRSGTTNRTYVPAGCAQIRGNGIRPHFAQPENVLFECFRVNRRRLQGHHKLSSAQLYSRNNTIEAQWLQRQLPLAVRKRLNGSGGSPLPRSSVVCVVCAWFFCGCFL